MFFFPIRNQLKFACSKCSDFAPSKYHIQKLLFTFSTSELVQYIKEHNQICEMLMMQSDDKRYYPSTIIMSTKKGYIVGRFNSNLGFEFYETQLHDNLSEASADYILLNWKLPRLHSSRSECRLKRKFGHKVITLLDEDGKIFDEIHS
jgi:hypothetical protein